MGKKKSQPAKDLKEKPKPSRWRENIQEETDETVAKVEERLKRQREKDEQ